MAVSNEDKSHILYASSTSSFDALVANDGAYAQDWMLDSGASYHVTPHREWFSTYKVVTMATYDLVILIHVIVLVLGTYAVSSQMVLHSF